MAEITILSVYHSAESKKLLEINRDLTKTLNPGVSFEWVVADNSAADFLDKIVPGEFTVVPGASHVPDVPQWIRPSFHHNIAMNESIRYAKTRFILFLDSDFYVVRHNWIREAIEHMKKNSLAFFGAPWHPKQYQQFRYFPAHQFLLVDTGKVDAQTLDFTPLEYRTEKHAPGKRHIFLISRILDTFDFVNRRTIGNEKHTAYRLFDRFYGDSRYSAECVVSVLRPSKDSYPQAKLLFLLNTILEWFLPDRLCYIPKDKSYWTPRGFKERGACTTAKNVCVRVCDAAGKGWEEFVWRDAPFAFHVRPIKQIKKGHTLDDLVRMIEECLASFS